MCTNIANNEEIIVEKHINILKASRFKANINIFGTRLPYSMKGLPKHLPVRSLNAMLDAAAECSLGH